MKYLFKELNKNSLSFLRQFQPLNITAVLSMRQILILRIHTNSTLILASLLRSQLSFENEIITLTSYHLQRLNRIDAFLTIFVNIDINLFKSNSII